MTKDNKGKNGFLKEWMKDIIIAVIVAAVVMQFIKPTIVKESSMEPNFYEDDYLFVSKQSYGLFRGTPKIGDVVIFKSNIDEGDTGRKKLLIKRVIGTPGDKISVHDGKVYVNDEQIADNYTKDKDTNGEVKDLIVPKDKYFVLGDNRTVSVDSRYADVGFVAKKELVGKVVFRLLPFKRFGTIKNPYNGN